MNKVTVPVAYYYAAAHDQPRQGPVSGAQLKDLAKRGQLQPTDIVWQTGVAKGVSASRVKGLFAAEAEVIPVAEAIEEEAPPVLAAGPLPVSPIAASPFAASPFAASAAPLAQRPAPLPIAASTTAPLAAAPANTAPANTVPSNISPVVATKPVASAPAPASFSSPFGNLGTSGTMPIASAGNGAIAGQPAPKPGEKAHFAPGELLEDPLRDIARKFATYLWIMLPCLIVASIFLLVLYFLDYKSIWASISFKFVAFLWMLFFTYWVSLIWWRAFAPRRDTDVMYLRSFKNDEVSWPIRVAIQEALGEKVRLSGICAPRRRKVSMSDSLTPWLRAMRTCTPKFMDLEAEEDWQLRLWNSLQHGKMAVVDLSAVTKHVMGETSLVTDAIGVERTLFLGVTPQTEQEVRGLIAGELGASAAVAARVMLWPGPDQASNRSALVRQFRQQFRATYDEIAAGSPPPRRPAPAMYVIEKPNVSKTPMSRQMLVWMIGVQAIMVAFMATLLLFSRIFREFPPLPLIIVAFGSLPLTLINATLFVYSWYSYVRDVGIVRRRVKAIVLMGALVALGVSFGISATSTFDTALTPPEALDPAERQLDNQLLEQETNSAQ